MSERILIIDDDIDTLKLVGLMLERQGYEIAVAGNGAQGLAKAAAVRPDLILLDVMMPDLDGYEVTRRLRSDPTLAHIPIIMFTAKSMVDDKVMGFEAGVDDYLTKPTHPAELTAHVKAVLARSQQARLTPGDKARVLGFIGARGGLGTTTTAVNVAVALQDSGHDVLIVEMNPGHGTLALELNLTQSQGIGNLLTRSLKDIHLRSVETEIANHKSGIRVLPASHQPSESELEQAVPQMEAILGNISALCTTAVLDLGAGIRAYTRHILELCDLITLVVEPIYPTTAVARALLDDIVASGISRHKLNLALITRQRTSLQIPWRQVQTDIGIELAGIVSPAPEQAHQASQGGMPLIIMHPESLVTDQINKMADQLASQMQPVGS